MKDNIIKNKSFLFAIRMVKLSQFLNKNKNEFVLAKQIIRSGTAIGALVREAEHAQSTKDFIHKLQIGLKEANETAYWLELLKEADLIDVKLFKSLFEDCTEIIKLLASIIITLKKKNIK